MEDLFPDVLSGCCFIRPESEDLIRAHAFQRGEIKKN
jgi:hypothetical protein